MSLYILKGVFNLNYLWPILILISFLFSLFNGTIQNVNNSIFSSVSNVVTLSLTLVGNMCLWCGLMRIIKETKIMNFLIKILNPVLRWLYPDSKDNKNVMEAISINTVSNFLGIGNAATPAGLKAMEELQKENENKDELSNSMIMLIVLNTTSIQLIPTTVIAIRASLGSPNPSNIIVPIWISTMAGTLAGVFLTKLLLRRKKI